MPHTWDEIFAGVRARAEAYGVRVTTAPLGPETAGLFDGLSVTLNPTGFTAEEQTYYLAHAVGSIVAWSVAPAECRAVFDELRDARRHRKDDPDRLEKAVGRYRQFEESASEYAVWLLADLGHADRVPSYTNFMRADIEALSHFHREGVALVWRDFFARWNAAVARGEQEVRPYQPRPIPSFRPVKIERTQEVLQEMDGKP